MASEISNKTPVRLQLAALCGGATFLVLTTWGVATYSTNITSSLTALEKGQESQAQSLAELSARIEALRIESDRQNWKVSDQDSWSTTFGLLNPEAKLRLPEIPKR